MDDSRWDTGDVYPEPNQYTRGDQMSKAYKVEYARKDGVAREIESDDFMRLVRMAKHWLERGHWIRAMISQQRAAPKTIEQLEALERLMTRRLH